MSDHYKKYDIIVVGGGHAGCESALAAARMGMRTLLLTMDINTIAKMSCNPAIGGVAKGQLVREIDAVGGEMGKVIDATGIQFRMLNKSKGPAVWSPRAQADRMLYSMKMREVLESQSYLEIKQAMVTGIIVNNHKVHGVRLVTGSKIYGTAVILTTGTFLNGLIHVGLFSYPAGRDGEFSATGLTEDLIELGFKAGRFKTGTPPRIDGDSIDYSKIKIQPGDDVPQPFSYQTNRIKQSQLPCFMTYTNKLTHDIIRSGLDRSPLYTGKITGIGPRYCPSIETKVVRFPEKVNHQLYLEPEGIHSNEYYLNGFATSLPEDIQYEAIHTIPGLETAEITRLGYAIEYDYFPPSQLCLNLETKLINNLFFAGQINGTSGYEEAAAQGLIAGINAVLKIKNQKPLILGRSQAYIGVLIDDLCSKEIDEPYRMFTSLAEYRLLLRQDNADFRLMELGYDLGLIKESLYNRLKKKKKLIAKYTDEFKKIKLDLSVINPFLEKQKTSPLKEKESIYQILRRPEISFSNLYKMFDHPLFNKDDYHGLLKEVQQQIEFQIKYEGYLNRQYLQIDKSKKFEQMIIPDRIDYQKMKSLSSEAKEKLTKFKPRSIAQAYRIAGISPADISILMIYLKK